METGHIQTTIQWRFACQKRNGTTYLHLLELLPDDQGPVIMSKLRTGYLHAKSQHPYQIWDRLSMFQKLIVEEAILSENSSTDLEAQQEPRRVILSNRKIDLELTAAMNHPAILSSAEGFLDRNKRFIASPITSIGRKDRSTIVVRESMSMYSIWVLMLGGIIFCVLAGVFVGISTKSFDFGVAVTSGLATVITCIEAFVFWMYK